ncbi:hypothetical protein [Pseudolabrys sp. FHR47]|uniref:hypothetical protein n=1 Tax=Pseudolabrys sp. FHR47 TaxID=2562284 RepID=UPI00197F2518|nr:hypothetical protein [Pseudolabrys sp. FHR47]
MAKLAAAVNAMTASPLSQAACIHAIPSRLLAQGFRLLTLREFRNDKEPPAFAWIEQRLLRLPQRPGRHGLFFANTFRPEIMAWLSQQLGRPSVPAEAGRAQRNALWPTMTWHGEDRAWPDGARTVEWFVDVVFPHAASWTAFQQQWRDRLLAEDDDANAIARDDTTFAAGTM